MSSEHESDGIKVSELKLVFNSSVRVYPHDPEKEQLQIDFTRASSGDPNLMAGRMVPGGTVLSNKIISTDKKKQKEFEQFVADLLFLDMMRAIHQRIAELNEIIEKLSLEIENNLEKLSALENQIDQRTGTIKQVIDYLRTGTVKRMPDGSLSDRAMNRLLLSCMERNNLQTQNLKAYSDTDIRMYLDSIVADQRSILELERKERRQLSNDVEKNTMSINQAIEERKQLQEIVEKYEKIQKETPAIEREIALNNLIENLDDTQIKRLHKVQAMKASNTEPLKEKTNEIIKELHTNEQKTTANYMKDLGM